MPRRERPANPYDNASCESFMKTLKREEIYANDYRGWRGRFRRGTPGPFNENGSFGGPFIAGPPCEWTWNTNNESGSGSVNNQGTLSCGNGTTSTLSFVGSGFLSSTPRLTIDGTSSTYTFYALVEVPDTATDVVCGGPGNVRRK